MKKDFLMAFLALGRVSNLPTVVSNVTVGFYLGGGTIENAPLQWLTSVIAISCFYEAGMILNDVFDFWIDLQERPERPLPSGRISRSVALAIATLFLVLGFAMIVLFHPQSLNLSILLAGLILTYNACHRRFRFAPFLMGACRGIIYLIAALAALNIGDESEIHFPTSVLIMAFGLTLYISIVSFFARDELNPMFGRIQHISAAALTGIAFWPVIFASHFGVYLFFGFLPLSIWFFQTQTLIARRRINPPKAVGRLLAGMSLWDGLVLSGGPSITGMILAWVCFGGARLWQRRIQST